VNRPTNPSAPLAGAHAEPGLGDPLLTIRELAAHLKLNVKTVERMARAGRLPSLRVCGRVRFRTSDIASWLAEREDRTCRDC
jgi:excisionase family DNA binding protein